MAVEEGTSWGRGSKARAEGVLKRASKLLGQKMLQCFWVKFFINDNIVSEHNLNRR